MRYLLTLCTIVVALSAATLPAFGASPPLVNGEPYNPPHASVVVAGAPSGEPARIGRGDFADQGTSAQPQPNTSPTTVVTTASPGFHWGDAGIGAAATAGALIAVLGGALLVLRRRSAVAA